MARQRVDVSVENLAALAILPVSELDDGTNAFVADQADTFTLRKSSGATPDGAYVNSSL